MRKVKSLFPTFVKHYILENQQTKRDIKNKFYRFYLSNIAFNATFFVVVAKEQVLSHRTNNMRISV